MDGDVEKMENILILSCLNLLSSNNLFGKGYTNILACVWDPYVFNFVYWHAEICLNSIKKNCI